MKKRRYHLFRYIDSKSYRYIVVWDRWLTIYQRHMKTQKDALKLIKTFDDRDEATQVMKALDLL